MRKTFFWLFLFGSFSLASYAQNSTIEGYVFESGNRGYLNTVEIKILKKGANQLITTVFSNQDGLFTAKLSEGTYVLEAYKDLFEPVKTTIQVKKEDKNKKVFTKIKMIRKPGYIFDVTLAELMSPNKAQVDAITGAKIEVYNNTLGKTELHLPNHPKPTFKVNFERGNHYSILIRKDKYFSKRLEAFVDVKGCILCFEGVGNVQPGVSDVLTEKNKMGTLLANISMRPMVLNRSVRLDNVTFPNKSSSLNQATIKELDNLLEVIKDNPHLTFEVGVHTDSKGEDQANLQLTQQQANKISQYLYKSQKIQPNQLVAKGFGENQLINGCKNEVVCGENLHRQNRRVEWKIIRHVNDNFLDNRSLAQIIEVERFNSDLAFNSEEQFVARAGEALPPEIAKDVESYGVDSRKITPTANPDGVQLSQEFKENDPYAEVTNATRLVDENYLEAIDREMMKQEKIPSVYNSTVKIDQRAAIQGSNQNRLIPSAYDQAAENRKIVRPNPQFGETMVASAASHFKTKSIPANYTGYKIEFVTALEVLPASHEIFNRHGNIQMERKTNGIFSYLLGNFKDQKSATAFLNEIMLDRYPNASIVFFENGNRLNEKKTSIRRSTKPASAPPR